MSLIHDLEKFEKSIIGENWLQANATLDELRLKNIAMNDWYNNLRRLAFGSIEDGRKALLNRLLAFRDDSDRFRLLAYICREVGQQEETHEQDNTQDFIKVAEILLARFPTLATYVKKGTNQNIFHVAANNDAAGIILIARSIVPDELRLFQALMRKDNNGKTPLTIAATRRSEYPAKQLETVKQLSEGASAEMITPSLLLSTLTDGHFPILQELVGPESGPRSKLVTIQLLERIVANGASMQIWNYLVTKVPPTSIEKSDLLKEAVKGRREDIIASLLDHNAVLCAMRDESDRCVLFYNTPAPNEAPDVQQRIRDTIVLKIIEICEPRVIRDLLKDSAGYRREISLDLSVLQNSTQELDNFLSLIQNEIAPVKLHTNGISQSEPSQEPRQPLPKIDVAFEPCLRDVVIPLFSTHTTGLTHTSSTQPHCEVEKILEWLKNRNVHRILSLQVLDSIYSPHTEETIEKAVNAFDVKSLDWRRMDISVDCILVAAKNVETLSLYASGSWAVLSHWTGTDGVGNLPKLKTVNINIVDDWIGTSRAEFYKSRADARLKELKKDLNAKWDFEVQPWTWGTPLHQNPHDEETPTTNAVPPSEALGITSFVQSYENYIRDTESKFDSFRTKIAIIDNGVSKAGLTCQRVTGASFVYNEGRESPWWLSQEPHGTQMANIIHKLDSNCELFIAKVGENKRDIQVDRALEAIKWAISKGVHVISMSLVLFRSTTDLLSEIDNATGRSDIVMLCSTADDGDNYQVVWPAAHESVLAIAACNAFGKVTQWSTEIKTKYLFQGDNILTTVSGREIRSSGSSVATAMAAGAVSLIVSCHRMYELSRGLKLTQRSRRVVVGQILDNKMLEKDSKDSKYIQPKLFFSSPNGKPMGRLKFSEWLNESFESGLPN